VQRTPQKSARTSGFTLAEVAVTIALVGLALVYMLQGLNTAKLTAAYTANIKLSKELALLTLGRIESGLYEEELDDERIEGTYDDDGYEGFRFEAVIGEANLPPRDDEDDRFFDNWRYEDEEYDDDDDEEAEQPYEKVQIRVTFPQMSTPDQQLKNELVIERWLPWRQLHPPEDDEDEEEEL
jgi:prepilin-type N-terminal cleavage/methylation domain-containing protein